VTSCYKSVTNGCYNGVPLTIPPLLGVGSCQDTKSDLILKFGVGPNFGAWSNHTWIYDPEMDEWTDVTQR
jgi:hypothetical protein